MKYNQENTGAYILCKAPFVFSFKFLKLVGNVPVSPHSIKGVPEQIYIYILSFLVYVKKDLQLLSRA